jgi:hypothetical protein
MLALQQLSPFNRKHHRVFGFLNFRAALLCGNVEREKYPETWAQNGRKTPPFWAQIEGWLVE